MINKTILIGRITRDPELRKTQNGKSVVSFTLACNRRFGEKDQADFINCVAWNHSAEFLASYIKKGALLGVEGRLQSRTYEDKDGKTVYVLEVVCDTVQALESQKDRAGINKTQELNKEQDYAFTIDEDSLPF